MVLERNVGHDLVTVELPFPGKDVTETSPREQKNSLKKALNYFREYCDSTSIHGFRYFGEKRTIYEKIWWFIVFVICLILCIFSIYTVYEKWDQSPVIVTFATKGKPISDIPFPAVTVCAESKIKTNTFDYRGAFTRKNRGEVLTEREESFLGAASYICRHRDDFNYSSINFTDSDTFLDLLKEVTPDFSIVHCKFGSLLFDCGEIFTPIITDEGLCYTFNILDRTEIYNENVVHFENFHNVNVSSKDWSGIHGYKEGAEVLTYPRRALLAGARYGLRFDLKIQNQKLDTLCRGSVEGYRILFHAPMRIPRLSLEYLRVPYNRVLSATITPTQIMTSDAVKNYPSEKRQCYFPSEKKLKYFNAYTGKNCDTECLTNYTLLACDCVMFYMPREKGTRICTAREYDCVQTAEYFLQYTRLYKRIKLKGKHIPAEVKKYVCECLPMCSDIEYKVGSSQSLWNWNDEIYKVNNTENMSNYYLTRVNAYFVNGNFIGSERNVLYGPTDFLANFGGLLGLFTGFSILSLMEIIYFLSVRLICNVRLYGSWAGQKVENTT